MMDDRSGWFAPKRYGFGVGLPISWQGWAALGIYGAVVLGSAYLFAGRPLILLSIVVPASVFFLVVTARTTKGGMRWRWGGDPG